PQSRHNIDIGRSSSPDILQRAVAHSPPVQVDPQVKPQPIDENIALSLHPADDGKNRRDAARQAPCCDQKRTPRGLAYPAEPLQKVSALAAVICFSDDLRPVDTARHRALDLKAPHTLLYRLTTPTPKHPF